MKTKRSLIGAFSSIVAGVVLMGTAFSMGASPNKIISWENGLQIDIQDIGDKEMFTYTDMDLEAFDIVDIKVESCPVEILPSDNNKYGVDVRLVEFNNDDIVVQVKNSTLTVEAATDNIWGYINFFPIGDTQQYVKVYLPEKEYEKINVDTSSASVRVEGVNVGYGKLIVDTSNGSVTLKDIHGENIDITTTNAAVNAEKVFGDTIILDTSNGKISMVNCEAEEIEADTSNGTVIMEKVYGVSCTVDTSNGKVELDTVHFTDELDVKTSNSTINVLLDGEEDEYKIIADTSNSEIYVGDDKFGNGYKDKRGECKVNLVTSNGRIEVDFLE